jgi:uncharacterized membrane protein YfcA|tara:strand:+ start:682 stop:1431 length:750 start_codon:yes stop_codon:yes gene_type:complete
VEYQDLLLVCSAAFFAGGLNSLAGGGSFITLPALLFTGIPPVLANTSSAAVLLPGYFGSLLGFRKTFRSVSIKSLIPLLIVTLSFSVIGAIFLINSSDEFFLRFIPWLILIATLLFIFNPSLESKSQNLQASNLQKVGVSFVAAYGGYFNGGLGIALLSVLSLGKNLSLKQMSAVKSLLSFLITAVSVTIFIVFDFVVWSYVFYMVLFSVVGGFFGAKLTESLPTIIVRRFIILIGVILSGSIFYINSI